ncbi:MAG: hypothetical protein FWG37_07140 [Clostridia bacterium]|nr:hypothetical protein [Clostridia bacterium]
MLRRMKGIPVPVAVAILTLCVLVGVALGNANVLRAAAKGVTQFETALRERSQVCAVKAGNLLHPARQYIADDPATAALSKAVEAHKKTKSIKELSAANANLSDAVHAMWDALEPVITEPSRGPAIGELDVFDSESNLLKREVGKYNEAVQKVRQTLATLPFRFLLQGVVPEVYP